MADGGPIAYDTLIVATGAHHSYFDHPEWAMFAPGLKTLEDATEIRRRILIAFEAAEREAEPERRRAWMTFVLAGGGPTGVELAGAIGEIAHDTLRRDFRSIRSGEARIILVEAMDRILPTYPADRSASAQRQLEHLGVEVRTRTRVVHIDAEERGGGRPGRCDRDHPGPDGALGGGHPCVELRAKGRRGDGRPDRSVGPDRGRAGPHHPRPPRDLRRRRCRGRAVEAGPPDPRRRPGRDPGRLVCGQGHPAPHPRPAVRAVPLQRPRRRRGHRPLVGRHEHRLAGAVRASERLHRLGAVARDPSRVPDRLLEPDRRPRPLGVDLPDPRPRHPAHHRQPAAARDRGARAPGPRADAAGRRARPRADPGCPAAWLSPVQAAAGTSSRNVVPSGPVRSTPIRPPLAASSSRAMVRPSPRPVGRPVVGSVARAVSAR